MNKSNYLTSAALLGVLAVTMYFNQPSEIHSMDLLSVDCNLETELASKDSVNCQISSGKRKNQGSSQVTVTKKTKASGSANKKPVEVYEVRTEVECDKCELGKSVHEKTVPAVKDIKKAIQDLVNAANKDIREQKELAERIERCEIDEDNEPYASERKKLECLYNKYKELDGEERVAYYNTNIKERVQRLSQSHNRAEQMLAFGMLKELGANEQVCTALIAQRRSSDMFASQSIFASESSSSEMSKNYIAESTCEMLAVSRYNTQLQALRFAANQRGVNPQDIAKMRNQLQSGWESYYKAQHDRFNNDPFAFNQNVGHLSEDADENQKFLVESLQKIVKLHSDLFQDPAQAQSGQSPAVAASRLARGLRPENGGNGTPAVNPWQNAPGASTLPNVGSMPAPRPMQPAANGYRGAPALGSVGTSFPQSVAPARR